MTQNKPTTNVKALFIMGVLYFMLGFITWLNGSLMQFLKLTCELKTTTQVFFVTSASYLGYFFLALPSAWLLQKTGYKVGAVIGLLVIATGSLIFIPASHSRQYPLFLTGLFVQSAGMAFLQTAINPYVSILGPISSAAKRISIMGICNKVAGMTSPFVLGAVLLNNASKVEEAIKTATDNVTKETLLTDLASRIVSPYVILTVILVVVAIAIGLSPLPEVNLDSSDNSDNQPVAGRTGILQFPHLLLGVFCIFVYVGVEVLAGDGIGIYAREQNMPLEITRYLTFYPLFCMLLGYLSGIILIPKYISQQKALRISAILGMIFSFGAFVTTGYVAIAFIALLGLAHAQMWPAIFPLAITGLGKFTKIGSGLLIMGIVGGSIIPPIYGILKDEVHLSNGLSFFLTMLPCYAYIMYYALFGHKIGLPQKATVANVVVVDAA